MIEPYGCYLSIVKRPKLALFYKSIQSNRIGYIHTIDWCTFGHQRRHVTLMDTFVPLDCIIYFLTSTLLLISQ